MKTCFLLIILTLGLANAALGQNLRWRFVLPTPGYQKDVTQATLAANDGSGGAVFHVTDYRYYPPEAGISGLETAGGYIIWLSRTGTLLYKMNLETLKGSLPTPILLTPTLLQIQIPNSAGTAFSLQRVVRRGRDVTVTNLTPPADETLVPAITPINTVDQFGYFTFKKTGETITESVRYNP